MNNVTAHSIIAFVFCVAGIVAGYSIAGMVAAWFIARELAQQEARYMKRYKLTYPDGEIEKIGFVIKAWFYRKTWNTNSFLYDMVFPVIVCLVMGIYELYA
jgi:hypothetical protein